MLEKLRESRGWQLLLITALILVVPLMVDVHGRIGVIRRMRQEEIRLERELIEVHAEHDALQQEFEHVTSDDYLEQWARVDARMTKPGQVAIIPLAAESSSQAALAAESGLSRTNTSLSIPKQWHRLFFDNRGNSGP